MVTRIQFKLKRKLVNSNTSVALSDTGLFGDNNIHIHGVLVPLSENIWQSTQWLRLQFFEHENRAQIYLTGESTLGDIH